MRNKIYFLSDFHLGAGYHLTKAKENNIQFPEGVDEFAYAKLEVERKVCRWLDSVKDNAKAIYLLGDVFDYWFEYKNVVPRGFTRFLGKISELTDSGVEVHFFIGNHDIWVTDYLQKECGMILHTETFIGDIMGKKFFLDHGDGLGDDSWAFQFIRSIFHNKFLRWLFAGIHPRWTVGFAHRWSNHSRATGDMYGYKGEENEPLVKFAKHKLSEIPDINFFIFGHRHILLDLMLTKSCRAVFLGDWINYFSYAVFDGENFSLELFEE